MRFSGQLKWGLTSTWTLHEHLEQWRATCRGWKFFDYEAFWLWVSGSKIDKIPMAILKKRIGYCRMAPISRALILLQSGKGSVYISDPVIIHLTLFTRALDINSIHVQAPTHSIYDLLQCGKQENIVDLIKIGQGMLNYVLSLVISHLEVEIYREKQSKYLNWPRIDEQKNKLPNDVLRSPWVIFWKYLIELMLVHWTLQIHH